MFRGSLLRGGFLAALAFLSPAASKTFADTIFPNPLFEMMYSPKALRLVDLNGDGHLDMIAAGLRIGGGSSLLMIRLGNGDSTFGPASTFSVGDTPIFIGSADLNEDGNLDLVVVNPDYS